MLYPFMPVQVGAGTRHDALKRVAYRFGQFKRCKISPPPRLIQRHLFFRYSTIAAAARLRPKAMQGQVSCIKASGILTAAFRQSGSGFTEPRLPKIQQEPSAPDRHQKYRWICRRQPTCRDSLAQIQLAWKSYRRSWGKGYDSVMTIETKLTPRTNAATGHPSPRRRPLPPLPHVFLDWFQSKGWAPRDHQLELLQRSLDGQSNLLIAPTGGRQDPGRVFARSD